MKQNLILLQGVCIGFAIACALCLIIIYGSRYKELASKDELIKLKARSNMIGYLAVDKYQDLLDIPDSRLKEGMIVRVTEAGKLYRVQADLKTWIETKVPTP